LKVSYSCMENMANIIKKHNATILSPPPVLDKKMCNCRNKATCPLNGKCLEECVVYKASVSMDSDTSIKHYYGLVEGKFKFRYNQHTHSFKHEENRHETALAKHIWTLKENHQTYSIAWSIAAHASPYKCGTRRCDLCLTEKLTIATADPNTMLNSRDELISTCRHRNKFRLKTLK